MRLTRFFGLLSLIWLAGLLSVSAQNSNLLTNPGLEEGGFGPYTGRRGGDFPIYAPAGWNVWLLEGSTSDRYNRADKTAVRPHPGPAPSPREGQRALSVDCGFHSCTAAIYQQVGGITAGQNVQASAWAQVKACNPGPGASNCDSARESGAKTRIGIDPNGGTDPNDADIVWSGFIEPHEQGGWQPMNVSATATGTVVTLFLYSTQGAFADINKTYWDQAELSGGGSGGAVAPAVPPTPTPPPFVEFVVPQGPQPDGSFVHTVQPGDTIDSIAFAYGVSRQQILDLNNIASPRYINIGQRLLVKPAPTPTPGAPAGSGTNFEEVVVTATSEPDAAAPEAPPAEAPAVEAPAVEAPPVEAPPVEASATPAPPTNTPAPAPVTQVASGIVNPAATTGTVCVLLFDDVNRNRIQETGEALLPGASITLNRGAEQVGTYTTDGLSEPHCFDNLAAGDYVSVAAAPQGYGLTTPNQLRLQLSPGAQITLNFGAAMGVQPVVPPPADVGGLTEEAAPQPAQPDSPLNQILGISGLIVFGLAGVVLVGGLGVALLLRRR